MKCSTDDYAARPVFKAEDPNVVEAVARLYDQRETESLAIRA
jgi:hypothetical protein